MEDNKFKITYEIEVAYMENSRLSSYTETVYSDFSDAVEHFMCSIDDIKYKELSDIKKSTAEFVNLNKILLKDDEIMSFETIFSGMKAISLIKNINVKIEEMLEEDALKTFETEEDAKSYFLENIKMFVCSHCNGVLDFVDVIMEYLELDIFCDIEENEENEDVYRINNITIESLCLRKMDIAFFQV